MNKIAHLLLMLVLCPMVYATELFPGGKPDLGQVNNVLPSGSTLGGYAIYQPGEAWRINTLSTDSTRPIGDAQPIAMGIAGLEHFGPNGEWVASMWITVNLNAVGPNHFIMGDPCAGTHLVTINKGKGRQDNCLTIDAQSANDTAGAPTLLLVKLLHTQSAGRIYAINLYLNLASLGYRGTRPADWTAAAADADPGRRAFVGRLKKWAESLQDASFQALAFNKPQSVFAAVPSFTTLGSAAADAPQ